MNSTALCNNSCCNLNSVAGHLVWPLAAGHFYCATKFAVKALTEGVRQELREMESNCRVTVCNYYTGSNTLKSIFSIVHLSRSCSY